MSAFGGKADIKQQSSEYPPIAISGHGSVDMSAFGTAVSRNREAGYGSDAVAEPQE